MLTCWSVDLLTGPLVDGWTCWRVDFCASSDHCILYQSAARVKMLVIDMMMKVWMREKGREGGRVILWLMSFYFTLITAPAVKAFLRLALGPWPVLPALSPHVLIERVTWWRLPRAAAGGKVNADYCKLTPTGVQQAASSKSWVARQHQMFNFLALNH